MDGIIFDLDGTLWDSTEECAKSWNEALEKETDIEKRLTAEDLKRVFGKPLEEIFQILLPEVDIAYMMSIVEKLYERQHNNLERGTCEPFAGVQKVFEQLSQRYPIFIVSNCQAGYIEVFLRATKLGHYITDHTCPGDTGMLKAENIKLIMERNHLKQAVYVGDTEGDKNACDTAGVPMIYAKYGFGEVEDAYLEIDSFEELLTVDWDKIPFCQ